MWPTAGVSAAMRLPFGRALAISQAARHTSRVIAHRPAIAPRGRAGPPATGHRTFAVSSASRQTAEAAATKPKTASGRGRPAGSKTAAAGKKKKTTAAAQPKKKKPARKPLTEEEKRRKEIRELKQTALLKEPTRLPDNAWLVYLAQNLKGSSQNGSSLGSSVQGLSRAFGSLGAAETEELASVAAQNKVANEVAYNSWVKEHTPEEIDAANKARSRLRRVFKVAAKTQIKDERQPKRPLTPYILFFKAKWESGDFKDQKLSEVAKNLASQWKALSAAERQPFVDSARTDAQRYEKEVKEVLHRDVRKGSGSS